jgi:hypothetical protein
LISLKKPASPSKVSVLSGRPAPPCGPRRRSMRKGARSVRTSGKQPVALAFTWPAGGLFKISSKPSATPPRLSRVFDNTLSQGARRSHFEKRFVRSKQWQYNLFEGRRRDAILFLRQQFDLCVTILDSYELSRLGRSLNQRFAVSSPARFTSFPNKIKVFEVRGGSLFPPCYQFATKAPRG